MADQVMTYKYVVKNVARAAGKTVTFMPKPLFGDNGSGMHTHQSLWKEETPLMADRSGYAGLSQLARAYVGGLLAHAPALLAFCAPTTTCSRRRAATWCRFRRRSARCWTRSRPITGSCCAAASSARS